jgi:hypothetical protein
MDDPKDTPLNQDLLREVMDLACEDCGAAFSLEHVEDGAEVPTSHIVNGRGLCKVCAEGRNPR